jgi:branched-chain amino acid transport system substrate-binding protein
VVDYDIYNLKARKIAIIHDTSEYGKGGKDGIVERLNEFGLKPIAIEAMNLGDTDMTTQILKLREAKPEVVHVYSYAKEAAILARQAKELGLNAQLILSGATTVPAFLETAGDGATGVLNFYHHPYLADSPHPLVVDLTNKLKASYRLPPGRPNYTDFTGYGFGMIVVEALQRAGKNVTWEKFISAMETIKNFNGGGYLLPTTFSSTDHNGQKSGRFLVVLPGKKWSVIADDVYPREKVEKVE